MSDLCPYCKRRRHTPHRSAQLCRKVRVFPSWLFPVVVFQVQNAIHSAAPRRNVSA